MKTIIVVAGMAVTGVRMNGRRRICHLCVAILIIIIVMKWTTTVILNGIIIDNIVVVVVVGERIVTIHLIIIEMDSVGEGEVVVV
jgi:hypothetical protein